MVYFRKFQRSAEQRVKKQYGPEVVMVLDSLVAVTEEAKAEPRIKSNDITVYVGITYTQGARPVISITEAAGS